MTSTTTNSQPHQSTNSKGPKAVTTQHRHYATISGEDLYRRVIETAQSGKRLPAGALLDADNYSDFIRAMTNSNNMDDNTAAALHRYL